MKFTPTRIKTAFALCASFLFSQALVLLILRIPPFSGVGGWLSVFRNYFSSDQLSYAAIAAHVSAGVHGHPEPFTETGVSYYPSYWYRFLGWVSRAVSISVPGAWNVLGWFILATAVAALGWAAWYRCRRVWAPALVGPALMVGTLSTVINDEWPALFKSHAALWGPYGALYALNANVAAHACIGLAIAIVLASLGGSVRNKAWAGVWLTVAGALVGFTANLHTYSFFVGFAMLWMSFGAYGLLRSGSAWYLAGTVALLGMLLWLGPWAAKAVSPVFAYGLFLLCAAPGVTWVLVRVDWRLALPLFASIVAALPQILTFLAGVYRGDEFLAYRQSSSANLGIPITGAVVHALPFISLWIFNLLVQLKRRNHVTVAGLAGLGLTSLFLAKNDVWGFNQEPYRFWIDSYILAAMFLGPLTACSLADYLDRNKASRLAFTELAGVISIVAVALSLADFGAFRAFAKSSGSIPLDQGRYLALARLAPLADGLVAVGPCLRPVEVKVVMKRPVAFYNPGLAWPERRQAIDRVLENRRNGLLDVADFRAAGVAYLVIDSTCPTQWPLGQNRDFQKVYSAGFVEGGKPGAIELWRLNLY